MPSRPTGRRGTGATVPAMAQLRWGDRAPTGALEARDRLVAAAEACIDRMGLSKTTVEDVAAEANVSRATIYRYFDNRDELMLLALIRELDRSLDRPLEEFLDGVDTPAAFAEAMVASSEYVLDRIRTNPKLHLLLSTESAGVTATIAGASQALFRSHAEDLRPHLVDARRRGLLRDDLDPDDVAEWILRASLSLLTVESFRSRTAEEERQFLAALLVPALAPLPTQPD